MRSVCSRYIVGGKQTSLYESRNRLMIDGEDGTMTKTLETGHHHLIILKRKMSVHRHPQFRHSKHPLRAVRVVQVKYRDRKSN